MATGSSAGPRRNRFALAASVVLGVLAAAGCGDSSAPEEPGLLRLSAADLDHSPPALAGFEEDDVTSYRVRILAGPRVLVDSLFPKVGPIQHDFELRPDTYLVEVQGFQGDEVLLLDGAGQATLAPSDTVPLVVDLDPAIGGIVLTIDGQTSAQIATNASAPVRVAVANERGQPVSGAEIEVEVDPEEAGEVVFTGPAQTGPDGTLSGTFLPAGGEFAGELRLVVDGFPVDFATPRSFSIVSPVDPVRSSMVLSNTFRVPADGVSTADIQVQVVDREGNPQAGIPVVVRSSRNDGAEHIDSIHSDQTKTDASGSFAATLTSFSSSNLAGDATIEAVADGKTLATAGTVNFLSIVSATASELEIPQQVVPADGTSFAEVVVTVLGHDDDPLPNVLVQIQTKDDSLFQLQPASGRTNASGVFRSRISSTTKTGTVIDVFADGLKLSAVGFVLFD
jgi:hypothetical protein